MKVQTEKGNPPAGERKAKGTVKSAGCLSGIEPELPARGRTDMRITKEQVLKVLEEKKKTSEPNVPTLLSHRMNVSDDARFIRQLRDEILAMPDVRAELVEEIRARIERGEYQVSAEDIVEAMIRRMIADQAD